MTTFTTWSDLPAKRRHTYVYAALLVFALAGNTIRASLAASSRHTHEKSVKADVVKFLGIDELTRIEPGSGALLESPAAK